MSFLENAKRAFSSRVDEYYDDGDYEKDYEEYEDYEEEPKKPFFSFLSKKQDEYDEEEEPYTENTRSYSSSFSRSSSRERTSAAFAKPQSTVSTANLKGAVISVLYPDSFNDATKIIHEVKANKITVFDISGIASDDDARRIVDYIGGAAEGMDCPFKRLCPSIFCITPQGVRLDIQKKY